MIPGATSQHSTKRDRVFVSYSHLDKEWLDKLREFLHPDIRNGRIDYRDDRNLEPGDKWYEELVDYIVHARVAVLLVSPNFLASRFIMENELSLILEAESQGLTILWVPLSGTFYGPNALAGAERVTRYQAVWDANQPLDASPEESRNRLLLDFCKQISKLVMTARAPNNLPFTPLGNLLKGREGDLARLDEQLRSHGSSAIVQPRAVSGPGGVGKTRLAVEYARRHEDDFAALLFVSASSPAALAANIARLSADDGALDLTEYKSASQDDQYAAVVRWLQQNKGWLLILDNVDTKEAVAAVQKLIAKLTGGHVIVTSRITAWGGGVPRIPLGVLSADAAVSLLIDKANSLPRTPRPDDAQQARLLAEQLGYLPLALTHAAAYVGELDLAFDAYLKEFDEALQFHEEEVIEYDSDPENAKILKTVATTYFLSIDRLGPVEKALLRAASFLAPAPIPIAMFADCPDEVKALVGLWCEETGEPSAGKSVRDALTELVRYSLIAREADVFTIHRMERLVLSHKVPQDRVPRWIEATRAALVRYGPDETAENPTAWPVWDRLRPHAEALVSAAQADRRVEPSLTLMIGLGQLYYGKGLYAENLAIDEAALGVAERVDGAESATFASRQLAYGETLRVLGRYPEAEAAFRKCLATNERLHGFESVAVASVLNYVAIAVGQQGRRGEQEDLLRKALTIYESEANVDEASADKDGFGKILGNLAVVLAQRGALDEAEQMLRRTLAHFEEALGSEHPRTLMALGSVGTVLSMKGDYAEAEPLCRRALEAKERVLGPEHPETLRTIASLAVLLREKGDYAAAEPLCRRALEARERLLGPEHPDTLLSVSYLGDLLKDQGDYAAAGALYWRDLEARERVRGPEHPRTLESVNKLAVLLYSEGDYAAAEPLFRRALEARERVLGPEHPDTLATLLNLTELLAKAGRTDESAALRKQYVARMAAKEALTHNNHPPV